MVLKSWTHPKTVKGKPSPIHGLGFFATGDIPAGDIVIIKGGHIIDKPTLEVNKQIIRDCEMQITDDFYIAPLTEEEFQGSMIYCNHSCEPNLGIVGNILFVALRDIKTGEEITHDHAMHLSDPAYTMICNCQTKNCRHTVTGNDWQLPELQEKYKGYFSWYIEQKIKTMVQ